MSKAATPDDKVCKLREIVKAMDIRMPTTADERGALHSRPMSNHRDAAFYPNPSASLFTKASR